MPYRPILSLPPATSVLGRCLLALILAGCAGETVGTITGTVTFKGRPLPDGIVSFVTDKGQVVTGRFRGGNYILEKVPVGPVRITVRQIVDPLAQNAKASGVQEIPLRYRSADDSRLTYTVVGGRQTHDLELTE
jgi:hypothetical protein